MSTASFDVSGVSDMPAVSGAERTREPAPYRDEDFPGCESFHLPASGLESYEGRLEFWDGNTETAWKVCEPTSIEHETPSRRLVEMATRVASLRGSRIAYIGSADLLRVDATTGRKHWLMQADEVLYLHPDRVRLMRRAIDVDADPLPDVVLEVDHTTDVRKRKLGIYKESGFPEVWVLVPWEASVRRPGLTIHVRRGDVYREEPESRAFPGWRAEEIHRALTESPLSETAWRALEKEPASIVGACRISCRAVAPDDASPQSGVCEAGRSSVGGMDSRSQWGAGWAERPGRKQASVPRGPGLRASPFTTGSKAGSNWMFCRRACMSEPSC